MGIYKVRVYFCCALLGLGLCAIIGRLVVVQIVQRGQYAQYSRNQSQQRMVITAGRGNICDCKGQLLAATCERRLNAPDKSHVKTARDSAMADSINRLSANGNRVYPLGEIGGSVLGYVSRDGYGLGGAELAFDRYLRGENGWAILQKDGRNKKYHSVELPEKRPTPGATVYLTLDADIQKIVYHVLERSVSTLHAQAGMAMVMDPKTGRILAMASAPAFNPNNVSRFTVQQRQNRCISYNYEPGSTFKLVTAATAITEHIKSETDLIDAQNGQLAVGDQVIRDHKAYGMLTFVQALAFSSNVCFAKIAREIGPQRLYKYVRDFGFGSVTGISLPGEETGILRPLDKWSARTHMTVGFGQEISATLLQMMLLYSAVANNGVLCKPLIVDRVVAADGRVLDSSAYQPLRQVISAETAARLRTMLVQVVKQGTGMRAGLTGIPLAGKTGTSQKIDPTTGRYSEKRVWSSFIGFMPVESPQLICGVVIDEPAQGQEGGVAAAPAFREIMQQIVSNPDLPYAARMLQPENAALAGVAARLPDCRGLPRDKAISLCTSEHIPFEIIGDGQVILSQTPPGGSERAAVGRLQLVADGTPAEHGRPNATIAVPDVLSRNLRDAVNMINMRGLKPYVVGSGLVRRQLPAAGSMVESAAACTLYCAFSG